MRRLFIGTILVSLLGAAVVGAVLAWTGSTPSSQQNATAGAVSVEVYWNSGDISGAVVVPDNAWTKVASGGITNTGDIAVHVTGGTVTYNPGVGPDCLVTGQLDDIVGTSVAKAASVGNLYGVYLKMATTAPDGCQSSPLVYDVVIDVES